MTARRSTAAHPGDFQTALGRYERELFPRSAEVAVEAARNLDVCVADDAPQSLLDMFAAFEKADR